MCGIAGFIGNGNIDTLDKMIQSIKYRGPNGQYKFIQNDVGFSHARLSIIDLSEQANQPMFTEDKRYLITFNGEIYNFKNLKTQFLKKYKFKSNSDTEVLLYMYIEFGLNMLDKIEGMFAFAIHDFYLNRTLIARDRMGEKPLYYANFNNTFLFSSELKAILKYPNFPKKINLEALNQFLTFDFIPTPNTIIKDIFKLEPAHYLIVENNIIVKKDSYWINTFEVNNNITFNDATDKLNELLENSTEKCLISDVPTGVFLSGGLDSSTITYYAQKQSIKKIKSFSIGFEEHSYNELNYSNQVADFLKTNHYTKVLTPKTTLSLIDEIFPNLDEPFADPSIIPTYFLSKFTKEHVDVVLGGDGSDELMAGYPTFLADNFKTPFKLLPKNIVIDLINFFDKILPKSDKNISLDFKIKQFLKGFLSKDEHIHTLWLGSFDPYQKLNLLTKEVQDLIIDKTGLNIIDYHYDFCKNLSDFQKISYTYYQTYLLDDILYKVDRASMLNSLEVRAPFLDRNIVDFLNTLPKNFKINSLSGKMILKKTMESKLPKNIIYRSKKGFGIPLSSWIRNELNNEIKSVLNSAPENILNKKEINLLLENHLTGRLNNRKLIWNLFVLIKYINQEKLTV